MKQQYRLWAIGVVTVLIVAALAFTGRNSVTAGQTLTLQPPAFAQASADESTISGIGAYLSSEAGISAYFQAPSSIVLNTVRNLYRTIETETAQYIIGSIAVPDYPESEDVHVYIHTDGWVLAYYLAAEPTGKIFGWRSYTGGTTISTKLENVLAIVASQIGAPTPTYGFYHFQYPNATNLMLIAESGAGDSFEVNLSGSYGYYERSWSLANNAGCCTNVRYYLDDVIIATQSYNSGFVTSEGYLSAAQLLPDTFHTIRITASGTVMGGLALIYRVP